MFAPQQRGQNRCPFRQEQKDTQSPDYLAGEPCIPTRYTHEQLGTMIGAGRVVVSRALAELREDGAVEQQRGRPIYVVDMETLERDASVKR